MPKFKDRDNLKGRSRKAGIYIQGSLHKIFSWFLSRNFTGQKGFTQNIQSNEKQRLFFVLKQRVLYTAKLSFRIKGGIKSFPDKNKIKECIATKSVLHEMLKSLL